MRKRLPSEKTDNRRLLSRFARAKRLQRSLVSDPSAVNFTMLKRLNFILWCSFAAVGVFLSLTSAAAPVPGAAMSAPVDRSHWPAALQKVPLERLSSGALMLLDRNGDLVRPAAQTQSRAAQTEAAAPVTLDLRVAPNIRLGDDPSILPPSMRAQAEPHIARSQVDPDFVVAVFQEGRFTDGGAVDCGYSLTHDGGLTWTRALIPGLTTASGGPYFRATDPVAGIDLSGNVFLNTEGATDSNFNSGVILVSRSLDGGATFASPVVVFQPANSSDFPDKPWMAVNNFASTSTAGRVLVTWTLFTSDTVSPIMRSYSDDHGATWSAAAFINATSSSTQGSQPVFLPDGRLAIVYWNFGTASDLGERIEMLLSNDGGVTFGAPILVTPVTRWDQPSIRNGIFLPSATTDRTTGNIYVAYQGRDTSNLPRILFTKSTNAGLSWSTPIAITNNPGTGVFNPAIGASPDGQTLTVSFYDERDNASTSTLCNLYLAQSFDGGVTWQPNIRLTSETTNATLAPLTSEGYMLGDYLGIAETTSTNVPAMPVWIDTRTGNPDPFVTRVGIAPQVDFPSFQASRLSLAQINDPLLGGQEGDADGDGENNLSEFISQTEPNDPNSVVHTARQLNISTRLKVGTGEDVLIGGFIVTGATPKKVILRALGPSLDAAGLTGTLQDPVLELHDKSGALIATNDNWRDTQETEIEMTTIPPNDDREAAIVQTLAPDAYTAVVRGKNDTTGMALVEAYDLDPTDDSEFGNISTRGLVETGDNVLIGGFIVGTDDAGVANVVLRALGPSLGAAGVTGALQDPTLELHDANGEVVALNDNWKESQETLIEATGLAPGDERESAILATLASGPYTAVVHGQDSTTGVGLVEIFNIP